MSAAIIVPKRLLEEARKRGLNIEYVVVKALAKALNADPRNVARWRLEFAERMLVEAEEYIRRGDPVQGSEELYKAVEECIKALAEMFNVPAAEEAKRKG